MIRSIPRNHEAGVYSITNLKNGRVYVGSSISMCGRMLTHRRLLRRNKHGNQFLQNSWNKHGQANFKFDVIEECDPSEITTREQHWIDTLKAYDSEYGYNQARYVEQNMLGRKHSKTSRAKMSASRKDNPLQAANQIAATKAAAIANRGKPRSQEVKDKMSKTRKARKFKNSLETRTAISKANKGRKHTPEAKAKMAEAIKKSWQTKKRRSYLKEQLSAEHKQAIGEGVRKHWEMKRILKFQNKEAS